MICLNLRQLSIYIILLFCSFVSLNFGIAVVFMLFYVIFCCHWVTYKCCKQIIEKEERFIILTFPEIQDTIE